MQVKLLTNIVTGVGLRAYLSRQRLLKDAYWLTSDAAAVNLDFHFNKQVFLSAYVSSISSNQHMTALSGHMPDLHKQMQIGSSDSRSQNSIGVLEVLLATSI